MRDASLADLSSVAGSRSAGELVIAVARPTGRSDEPLPIGVAGAGFDGDLTSASTRTDGYVLSTDLAPTILERLGIGVPASISGQAIEGEGWVDPAGDRSAGRADGRDLRAARNRDRVQPARLALAFGAPALPLGAAGAARPGCGWSASRSSTCR